MNDIVTVELKGKSYEYKDVDGIMNWVDQDNEIVPVILHPHLREIAISNGVEDSVFLEVLETEKTSAEEIKPSRKNKKKDSGISDVSLARVRSGKLYTKFNPLNAI